MEFNTLSLILCIALVVIGIVCFFIGITYRKKVAEKEIGSAEEEARRIINESIKGGENKKREMLLEAKEEIHKSRTEYEKEVKERRSEIQKQERRLQQKEESLDKKLDLHEKKEEELAKKAASSFSSPLPPPFFRWKVRTVRISMFCGKAFSVSI